MDDVKRAASPPASAAKGSSGERQGWEGRDPTLAAGKTPSVPLPSSTTSIRHESSSTAVDELVDDCDIPETIVENSEEDDAEDEGGGDARDANATNDDATRPVLLQPLLSEQARASAQLPDSP